MSTHPTPTRRATPIMLWSLGFGTFENADDVGEVYRCVLGWVRRSAVCGGVST